MWEPAALLVTLCLHLGVEVVRQMAFAMPAAFAWEFERDIAWWSQDEHTEAIALLVTGLAAGAISVLTWPLELADADPLLAIAAIASPVLTAFVMCGTGTLLRALGKQPLALLDIRSASIVAIGISLTRIATLSQAV